MGMTQQRRKKIEGNGNLIALYLESIGNFAVLSPEEERELAQRIEQGDLEAKKRMILHNLKLVVSVAIRYFGQRRQLTFLDLIQEGNLGLFETIKHFDYRLGYKFSSYATIWIKQSIILAIKNQGRTIRLPASVEKKLALLRNATKKHLREKGQEPTLKEKSQATGISPQEVARLSQLAKETLSLEASLSPDGQEDFSLLDLIPDSKIIDPEKAVEQQNLREILDRAIKNLLSPREQTIVRRHFGLGEEKDSTLEKIGQAFEVTRERIRQIQAKAFGKLKRSQELREFRLE